MNSKTTSTITISISSLDEFQFNESAEFHKLISPLTQDDLNSVYEQYDDSEKCFEAKTNLLQNTSNGLNYCFFAFRKQPSKPTFCESINKDFHDQKTGYFLIVYNRSMSAMFRQNISVTEQISAKQKKLNYEDLVDYNINDQTVFKRLDMQGIDGSEYAIRSKSFEGKNLRKNVSALSSSRYYIRSMRGLDKDKSFSMNLGTSRLNHYKSGKKIGEITKWVKTSFSRFASSEKNIDGFLYNFAKRTKFESFKDLTPSYLLLNFATIFRILENDDVQILYAETDYGKKFINQFEKIDDALPIKIEKSKYVAKVGKNLVTLDAEEGKIKITCDEWKKVKIVGSQYNDYNGNLNDLMNRLCLFNVYFEKSRKVYSSGCLLEDSKLLGNVDELLNCLVEEPLLDANECHYEKYYDNKFLDKAHKIKDPKYVPPSKLEDWDPNSEFKIVETKLGLNHSHLVCDDCENEWADYIGVSKNEIEFFACKYKKCEGDGSISASNFQDVVGQAIKNLENFSPTEEQLNKKIVEWGGCYQSNENIPRRIFGSLETMYELWVEGLTDPYLKKTFSLVVNFLSKEILRKKIEEIQNGGLDVDFAYREPAYQLLQILSTFVHSCKELGIAPKIYCRK